MDETCGVTEDFFYQLAQNELESGRYVEAAICIANTATPDNGSFTQRFDIQELCSRLIMDLNKTHEAKLLLNLRPELISPLVENLSTPKFAKTATKLIIDYNLDIGQYPRL